MLNRSYCEAFRNSGPQLVNGPNSLGGIGNIKFRVDLRIPSIPELSNGGSIEFLWA